MRSPEEVRDALDQIRRRIHAVGGEDVQILAVTKGFGIEAIVAAQAAGVAAVGENYVQELLTKLDQYGAEFPTRAQPPVEFIGQLQTNKVKYLAGRVVRYSSVDRRSLIAEIAKRDPGAEVLIQVSPSGDQDLSRAGSSPGGAKGGCDIDEVDELTRAASDAGLVVAGLMTVGPTQGGPEAARAGFARVRAAVDRLGLAVCSMGMSSDIEVAVDEGSTQVRVGSALFGDRKTIARSR